MDAFLKEEKRGFQEGARGETPINLNPSAEPIASYEVSVGEVVRKFWATRKNDALIALKSESDLRRREELESAVARADAHLKGTAQ